MREQIIVILRSICRDLFHVEAQIELERPESIRGDYSTNIALKLAPQLEKQPREVAEMMVAMLNQQKNDLIEKVEVAGPGFLNISLTNNAVHDAYLNVLDHEITKKDQVLVEFGDPNPFKEMHIGHLYSSIAGDTIASLLEHNGNDVKRLSYHGDVGPHVAKWVWAVLKEVNSDESKIDEIVNSKSLGEYYAEGAKAYEMNDELKREIDDINENIYKKDNDLINKVYKAGFDLSFTQFEEIFKEISVSYDKRYLESESSKAGLKMVNDNIGKVFEQSDGAVVFRGEKAGLHTRVFINSRGLTTYEAKDLGLTELKDEDYPNSNLSIVITANEQQEYFKVMLAALAEIKPELAAKTKHITHGFLGLTTGKMSSRSGDVYAAETLLGEVKEAINNQFPDSDVSPDIFVAAVRYTFLKQRIGADIIFNPKESVALDGNSGPYIQYAHARAASILDKSEHKSTLKKDDFEESERLLARKISEFPEIVEKAVNDLMPHYICTYLYELAQEFNRFYEKNRVIDDPRMDLRICLVEKYSEVLKAGLKILNIPAPLHM